MEIVSLLAPIAFNIAAKHIGKFFTLNADVVDRAIRESCSGFPGIEGTETTLQRWASCDTFIEFFEQVRAGERVVDDEIVDSFINEGGFYLPTDEECRTVAAEILSAFLIELADGLYKGAEGHTVLANRQEELHRETTSEVTQNMDAGFADLKAEISSLRAIMAAPAEPVPETPSDPVHREMATKINLARDLINQGLVSSARVILEGLKNEAGVIPEELEFRIATNLGACALAEDNIDEARAFLEKAYRLQPGNPKAIANAALAAHLGQDPKRAVQLALKVRETDPRNSQATATLIEGLWKTGESNRLQELVSAEGWMTQDRQCGLVLAMIRMQESRFDEAVTLCRYLIKAHSEDATIHLTLSECLLGEVQAGRLPVGYTDESVAQLREAEAEATRAIELLGPTELKAPYCGALVARAIARTLLGVTTEAMRDLDEVLEENPTHSDAAFNKGLLLLCEGRPAEARAVFESIQDSVGRMDAVVPLAEACLLSGDFAAVVELLRGTLALEHIEWKEVRRSEALSRAEAEIGDEDSVEAALEGALEQHPDDPLLLTLAAVRREILDDREGAEDCLLKALEHASESDRGVILVRLGALYQNLGRFAEAADRFSETVNGVASHLAAIPLLECQFKSKRLRNALDWARRIRETLRPPPRIAIDVEAQILDYIGDAHAALLCREDLCSRTDATAIDQVKLALVQFRCGEHDAALDTVLSIDTSELCHDPQSILLLARLAQLKRMLGAAGHLDDAYLARRCGLSDPAIHLGYVGLFLDRDTEWVEPEVVGPGCAIKLRGESVEQWWHILDSGEESHDLYELLSNDDLARRLLGRRVGDTIMVQEGIEGLSYEIAAVQSKFVRAFQETLDQFSSRFPGNMGLSRINMEDNDYTRVFLSIDRRDQFCSGSGPVVSGEAVAVRILLLPRRAVGTRGLAHIYQERLHPYPFRNW